jgi:SAM-dependent methyltransferase
MTTKNSKIWAKEMSKIWAVGTSPERPCFEELAIYEDYLQKIISKRGKKIRALLLGATPELRDLLAKNKIETVCADINPDMVKAMNDLLEFSDGKEKIIITDWLNISEKFGKFDVILGDHFLHWIPFEKWDDFFENKKKLLKKNGFIIVNTVTVEENEFLTVEKMLEIFKNKKFFTREEKFYYTYLAIFGLEDIAKNLKYTKRIKDYNSQLDALKKQGKINFKEYKILSCPWVDSLNPVMPPKSEVDKIFNKHFTLKSIRVSYFNLAVSCHKIYFAQKQ